MISRWIPLIRRDLLNHQNSLSHWRSFQSVPLFNCFYLCACIHFVYTFFQMFLSVPVFFVLFVPLFNFLFLWVCFPIVCAFVLLFWSVCMCLSSCMLYYFDICPRVCTCVTRSLFFCQLCVSLIHSLNTCMPLHHITWPCVSFINISCHH